MQYDIRALSVDQLVTQLTLEASDEEDARRQVEAQGLFAASIKPAGSTSLGTFVFRPSKVRNFSLVLFSQELLALLRAGLGIVESLEALLEKESNIATHHVLSRLLSGLREGKRFSTVLAEQADLFPPLYVGIIQAAEGTSDLPQSLSRYIDYQQRIDSVRSKVISALIYPMILMVVGGSVTFFLVGFVVPRFAEVYRGAGRNLPWLSQLLLDWGQFAATHKQTLLIGIAALVVLAFVMVRHLLRQGGIVRLIRAVPSIHAKVKIYELSRLYLTLGMLMEGGIPIMSALGTVKGIVSTDMKTGLEKAREAIQSGVPFSSAFEACSLTTPISLRMLRVGERSGELGQMLTQSATFYDGEITRWIDRFTRTFEPVLMAAIGLIVGAIVVLLYMPIFDLAGSLS